MFGEGESQKFEVERKDRGIGWLDNGGFGPGKVTLLHNGRKLLPPQI